MIDILFLAYNRQEFTAAALKALWKNTCWKAVQRTWLYDDGSTDGTLELLRSYESPTTTVVQTELRSPVAITNDFLTQRDPAPVFAKIDNDTMVCPGWLEQCLDVMDRYPEIDLLGIEPMYPCEGLDRVEPRGIELADTIGGIGLMRTRAFTSLPVPDGRMGFTGWQSRNSQVKKAWINPALPVFLLNRLPIEPWATLSATYVQKGWQRAWPGPYRPGREKLWSWWDP